MSHLQGIGTLAAGVALGVLATSSYFRLWNGRAASPDERGALLRFSPDLSTQTIRSLDPQFAVCYDRRTRVPLWTIEHLTRETITMGKDVDRGKAVFREDDRLHPYFRSTNQDYAGKIGNSSNERPFISMLSKARVWTVVTSFQVRIIDILKKA